MRPRLVGQLLTSLAAQTFPVAKFEVIVVDNDNSESAQATVQRAILAYPDLRIRYAVEVVRGISYARNKAVSLSTGELIAFIDDDESASSNWLNDLVAALRTHDADAVLGPVIPKFPPGSRAWVLRTGFFERPRFSTGTLVGSHQGRTGNAIVKASVAKSRAPLTFDAKFALSGGEDYEFFKWLEEKGGRVIWCDSAIVWEEVPLSRQTVRYMLLRSYRSSFLFWREEYAGQSKLSISKTAGAGFFGGIFLILAGLLVLPLGFHRAVNTWRTGATALGRVAAIGKGGIAVGADSILAHPTD